MFFSYRDHIWGTTDGTFANPWWVDWGQRLTTSCDWEGVDFDMLLQKPRPVAEEGENGMSSVEDGRSDQQKQPDWTRCWMFVQQISVNV